jgi:hypothetical protein
VRPSVGRDLMASPVGVLESALLIVNASCIC